MAFNYALNKIKKLRRTSYNKLKDDAVDYKTKKPFTPEEKSWQKGRLSGLRVATSSFYAGQKAGFTKGRKAGFKSGRNYGTMSALSRRSYHRY